MSVSGNWVGGLYWPEIRLDDQRDPEQSEVIKTDQVERRGLVNLHFSFAIFMFCQIEVRSQVHVRTN